MRSEQLAEDFVEPVDRLLLSLEVEPEDLVERPLVHEHQDTRLKPSHEFEHARYARTVLGIGGSLPIFARHLDDVGETVAVIEQRVILEAPRGSVEQVPLLQPVPEHTVLSALEVVARRNAHRCRRLGDYQHLHWPRLGHDVRQRGDVAPVHSDGHLMHLRAKQCRARARDDSPAPTMSVGEAAIQVDRGRSARPFEVRLQQALLGRPIKESLPSCGRREPSLGISQRVNQANYLMPCQQARSMSLSDQPERAVGLNAPLVSASRACAFIEQCNRVVRFGPRQSLRLADVPRPRAEDSRIFREDRQLCETLNSNRREPFGLDDCAELGMPRDPIADLIEDCSDDEAFVILHDRIEDAEASRSSEVAERRVVEDQPPQLRKLTSKRFDRDFVDCRQIFLRDLASE